MKEVEETANGKQRRKSKKCPETPVEKCEVQEGVGSKNNLKKSRDMKRKNYLKSLLNQAIREVEEEAKEIEAKNKHATINSDKSKSVKNKYDTEEVVKPSKTTKNSKESSKKAQPNISVRKKDYDQRRKRKEEKGQNTNIEVESTEISQKHSKNEKVQYSSDLKKDQINKKEEKLWKKSKKCKKLETADPTNARKRRQSCVPDGEGPKKKGKVDRDVKNHSDKKKKAISVENSKAKVNKEKKIRSFHHFKPEEDEYLKQIIDSGENVSFSELGRRMNRAPCNIIERMKKIKHGEDLRIFKKAFTLEEDLIIIDSLIQNLLNGKTLRTALSSLYDFGDKAIALRPKIQIFCVHQRWNSVLQPWLLSYFEKTLNLEIRPMLSNYLRDNFETRQQIDWDQTLQVKSFSGQTVASLKALFKTMIGNCRQKQNIKYSEVTLQDIVEYANSVFPDIKVYNPTKKRQQAVIEYFEESVKKHNIKNFLN